jgi:pimeloyl-ACP methyl ester carboxylesterase
MFKNFFIFVAVLCCCNMATAQNVFDPTDPMVTYNSAAAAGSATNPFQPSNGVMAKWVRTVRITNWTTSNFKSYIWNNMVFRLRFPNNYDPANASKYPVIVFFHGGGEIAPVYDNDYQLLWGAQLFEQRINQGEWNGFLLFPQETSIGWNDYHFSRINSILDTLQKYNNADPDRVISMGLSTGGLGSLSYANLYPKRVAAALPASPAGVEVLMSGIPNFAQIPVWVANGGTDTNPGPYVLQDFYSAFHNAGGNIYRTFYATLGHSTWSNMWNMKNAAGGYITSTYWNNAHKAQPLVYFQNQQFCSSGPIAARMAITAGYYAYEWDQNGITIPGANANEYTATQAGQYRVRFMRDAGGVWSSWTPNPVVISTKVCAADTVYAENFSKDNAYTAVNAYSKNNFNCQNGIMTNGTDVFTQDAAGIQGGQYLVNYTKSASGCTYAAGNEVWGTYNSITVLPNTNYEYSFYIGNQSATSLAQLAPTINGVALIPGFIQATGTGNASWKKFTYTWNSGIATTADLGMINRSIATTGNEFVLDEVSFKLSGTIRTLPVTWLQVSARLIGKETKVTWKTADEVNVDNYIVERSSDGISFTTVAVVNAYAVTQLQNQYEAIDRLVQKGINYYRIKQTDNDGKYSYSKTVVVNSGETGNLLLWPNPAAATVNVQNNQTMLRLQCFNSNGQLVYDIKPGGTQYAIPVQQWAPGVYYVKITGSTQVAEARFIKQ